MWDFWESKRNNIGKDMFKNDFLRTLLISLCSVVTLIFLSYIAFIGNTESQNIMTDWWLGVAVKIAMISSVIMTIAYANKLIKMIR